MNKISLQQLFIVFFIITSLNSCGFSLRGVYNISDKYKVINLQGKMDDDFKKYLIRSFQDANITIKTTDDATILDIKNIIRKKNIQSLKTNGTVDKYYLSVGVTYRINGDTYKANATGILNFDENNIHANNSEQEIIYNELNKKSIRIIMIKLQSMK
ncbi:MAG: hypothetical protein DRQ51_05615 [Gammaproteobacteria bacterium]|nr:MAG: hypothetical protein DRQ51_05615 [Gammaproteobacteria bacterium]